MSFNPFAAPAPAAAAPPAAKSKDAPPANPFAAANPFATAGNPFGGAPATTKVAPAAAKPTPAPVKAAPAAAKPPPAAPAAVAPVKQRKKIELSEDGVAAIEAHKKVRVKGTEDDAQSDSGTDTECGAGDESEAGDTVPELPKLNVSAAAASMPTSPVSSPDALLDLDNPNRSFAPRLRRTPSLSNKSQLQLMQMVRDGKLNPEQAMDWAERKEHEETVPQLSNATQIKILSMVKSGQLSKDEAIAFARKKEDEEAKQKKKHEGKQHIQEFYDILGQISELQVTHPGAPGTLAPPQRTDSLDSLDRDMKAAKGMIEGDIPLQVDGKPAA